MTLQSPENGFIEIEKAIVLCLDQADRLTEAVYRVFGHQIFEQSTWQAYATENIHLLFEKQKNRVLKEPILFSEAMAVAWVKHIHQAPNTYYLLRALEKAVDQKTQQWEEIYREAVDLRHKSAGTSRAFIKKVELLLDESAPELILEKAEEMQQRYKQIETKAFSNEATVKPFHETLQPLKPRR